MCQWDTEAPNLANRKQTYDRPENWNHSTFFTVQDLRTNKSNRGGLERG